MPRHDLLYPNVTAHTLVATTAVGMAQEIYEELCSGSNALFHVMADREDFVRRCAPTLRKAARIVLAGMLNDPKVSQAEKDTIHEALILDASLPTDGTSVTRVH